MRASESELFEAALTYYSHGELRARNLPLASAVPTGAAAGVKRLGAYIGKRTALLSQADAAGAKPDAGGAGAATAAAMARAGEAEGPESSPRHVCAELSEPCGPMYVGRTYFLGGQANCVN